MEPAPVFHQGDDEDRVFVVSVGGDVPLWKMIHDGNYRYVDPDLTPERFGTPVGAGPRTMFFTPLDLGELPDGRAAIAEVAARGVRGATLSEILAVCAAHPAEPAEGSLVALGSVWQDDRLGPRHYVPLVAAFCGTRRLELHPLGFRWPAHFRALVTGAAR
jgi:hypothetical protein